MEARVPILCATHRWVCPNCNKKDVTFEVQPHSRFHRCRGLKGILAPMVPEGIKCKVIANEREDYIGEEDIRYDGENRPIMNVTTVRDDGQDCTVFAPCARAKLGDLL